MTSWTYTGDFQAAHHHLPFAKSQQMMMNHLGHDSKNLQVNASDSIIIRKDHIHINAGLTGYEFYANEGGFVQAGGTLGAFFKDGIKETTPIAIDVDVPEYDPNAWYSGNSMVTGGHGTRYHTSEGFIWSPLGWLNRGGGPLVYNDFPKVYKGGAATIEGDASVMGAAILGGYLIGISTGGNVYAWDAGGIGVMAGDIGTPAWGSDDDTYNAFWVFNKAGNQCAGLTFRPYAADSPTSTPNDATVLRPHLTVVNWAVDSDGAFSLDVITDQKLATQTVFAVDYDMLSEGNELLTAHMSVFDYTVGMIPDPDPPPSYLDAQDAQLVITQFSGVELLREMVNYNSSFFNGPSVGTDQTKDRFHGSLFSLDLRYQSYGVFIWQYGTGATNDPDHNSFKIVNRGTTIYQSGNWIDLPLSMTGAGQSETYLALSRWFTSLTSAGTYHPVQPAAAFQTNLNFTVSMLDFMYTNGNVVEDYHLNAYGTVTASTNLKLSGVWVSNG